MSGLLERIVRRRRASASTRLGPPAQNGHPSPYDVPYLNGHATELAVTHVNGSVGSGDAPELVHEGQAVESLEVIDVVESHREAVEGPENVETADAEPEATAVPDAEPEATAVSDAEPEATAVPDAEPEATAVPDAEPEATAVPDAEPEPEAADVPEGEPEPVEVDAAEAEAAAIEDSDEPEAIEEPEPAAIEDSDEPAPIEDESPTMEHKVLVLDEFEHDDAGADPAADRAADPEPDPAGAPGPPVITATAAQAPAEPPVPEPHFRGRSRIRRRARYLRKLREIQLSDIGGFAVELHRFGVERPDLLAAKIADAARTDAELRALEEALGAREPMRELREAGIGGVCPNCGTVHGSEDQFCAMCGEPVGPNASTSRRSTEFDDYFGQG